MKQFTFTKQSVLHYANMNPHLSEKVVKELEECGKRHSLHWEDFKRQVDINGRTFVEMDTSKRCLARHGAAASANRYRSLSKVKTNHMTKGDLKTKFAGPQASIHYFSYESKKHVFLCKKMGKERMDKKQKSGTNGINMKLKTKWLEEKLFEYTESPEENVFYARQEEEPKGANELPVYVILHHDNASGKKSCVGVCLSEHDHKTYIKRCNQNKSKGKFSSKRTDLHSFVKDIQDKRTSVSYTDYLWRFVTPFYQINGSDNLLAE